MKIVIAQNGIKRELEGPFAICLGKQDLEALKERLNEVDAEKWCYGWLTIYQKPVVDSPANTPPSKWST